MTPGRCVYEQIEEHDGVFQYRCVQCGHKRESRHPPERLHRPCKKGSIDRKGLGDCVEQALAMVGITSERIEKWLEVPCNCDERKEKLNRLGRWVKRILGGERPTFDDLTDQDSHEE